MTQIRRQQNDNHIFSHNYIEVMICKLVSTTSIVYWKIFTYIIHCTREEFREIRKSDYFIFIM